MSRNPVTSLVILLMIMVCTPLFAQDTEPQESTQPEEGECPALSDRENVLERGIGLREETEPSDAKASAEKAVREIRRKTRRRFSAEEKIRIVIERRG